MPLVRSGETEDCFIADLVVGLGTGQIKTGAPCRFLYIRYIAFRSTLDHLVHCKCRKELLRKCLTGLSVLQSTTSCSELRRNWAPMLSLQGQTSARLEIFWTTSPFFYARNSPNLSPRESKELLFKLKLVLTVVETVSISYSYAFSFFYSKWQISDHVL